MYQTISGEHLKLSKIQPFWWFYFKADVFSAANCNRRGQTHLINEYLILNALVIVVH
jgi:hypothetical protein